MKALALALLLPALAQAYPVEINGKKVPGVDIKKAVIVGDSIHLTATPGITIKPVGACNPAPAGVVCGKPISAADWGGSLKPAVTGVRIPANKIIAWQFKTTRDSRLYGAIKISGSRLISNAWISSSPGGHWIAATKCNASGDSYALRYQQNSGSHCALKLGTTYYLNVKLAGAAFMPVPMTRRIEKRLK